ncbi:uncharacterized protein Dwil_GK26862 [Drosophila willistoni]|uniref:Uncharacterized protein n=1 Tax=Drosophila willistoni TaxID=7260 RepID=A0A0Q9WT13_DROWI|nr:uncharacterized protein Dwil_GK26862 [Drosophila willistoni]
MPNAFKTQSQPPAAADASESSSSDTAKAKRLKHVYITTVIYVVVALLQLTIVKVLNFDFSKDVPVPGFVWILVSLVSFLILLCTGAIYLFPVNWTLSVIIIEAITLSGMSRSWHAASLQWVLGAYLIVLLLYIILGLLAIFLPLKLLPANAPSQQNILFMFALCKLGFPTINDALYHKYDDYYYLHATCVIIVINSS